MANNGTAGIKQRTAAAKAQINKLYEQVGVTQSAVRAALIELRDECTALIDVLPDESRPRVVMNQVRPRK